MVLICKTTQIIATDSHISVPISIGLTDQDTHQNVVWPVIFFLKSDLTWTISHQSEIIPDLLNISLFYKSGICVFTRGGEVIKAPPGFCITHLSDIPEPHPERLIGNSS